MYVDRNDERPTRVNEPSDEALMRGVRDGDVATLGTLFERHHRRVYALCYRLVRRADVADDLVQETFFRVLRYRETFREEAAFLTWLYRIAWNVCQEHWRQARRDELSPAVAAQIESSETSVLDDRHVLLDDALGRLEPEHRAVLVLTRYHDLKYDDVARVLRCTPAAARVRAHRALNELREIYRELEQREGDLRRRSRGDRR
jgi:RNA polymerase sigma factor (sigma-70 family)